MHKQYFVAVYGTLKRNKPNHSLMSLAESEFIGEGKTADKYPLIVGGRLPYLFENVGVGEQIKVEIYKVDFRGLQVLDKFEGHPNFYTRKPVLCEFPNGEKAECFIYFINKKRDDFSGFKLLKNY